MKFRQSPRDFPALVELGKVLPNFKVSRIFHKGLSFSPEDEEGFDVRYDRQRILYKGRRKSHRFTVLGDSEFEYDCILNSEPETNLISLRIGGADRYDFFKQPYFVRDPFLKGSIAVYKKENLVGEGTGKLCHIRRPLIIDALGRKVWGDVDVIHNKLVITIPEEFLAYAKYPVVVDPTVGTSTVGAQYLNMEEEDPGDWFPIDLECQIALNKFVAPSNISGLCTAYFYTNDDTEDEGVRPILYSDNGNKPYSRLCSSESLINLAGTGWKSGTFNANASADSNIWFGGLVEYMWMVRYDFGKQCYRDWWLDYTDEPEIPQICYPNGWFEDMLLSMYFTYSDAQNYVRTLTQGVSLGVSENAVGNYLRVKADSVSSSGLLNRSLGFIAAVADTVFNSDLVNKCLGFFRGAAGSVGALHKGERVLAALRNLAGGAAGSDAVSGLRVFLRSILENVAGSEFVSWLGGFARNIASAVSASGEAGTMGDYVRGLIENADAGDVVLHSGAYHRGIADAVGAVGNALRHLGVFVKILNGVLNIDYVLSRFLKSKEQVVLKSCVSREVTIESRI
jgi:hypothetical protein